MSIPLLVEQRVRNRIIEWLELVIEYETDPPPFDLNELLNQWEDWNSSMPQGPEDYPLPVYTPGEALVLCRVSAAWSELCDATPKSITNESLELGKPQWFLLVAAATSAFAELSKRGKLPEDNTISN